MTKHVDRTAIIRANLATWRKAYAERRMVSATVPAAPKPPTATLRMKPRAKSETRSMAVGTNGGAPGTGINRNRALRPKKEVVEVKAPETAATETETPPAATA